MTPLRVLTEYVRRHNDGVSSGDFSALLALFAEGAELSFEPESIGPFIGRSAIAAAFAAHPPDDLLSIVSHTESGDTAVAVYRWRDDQAPGGRIALTCDGDVITRLRVSRDDG